MSFCGLRLAARRRQYVSNNGSSKRGARGSAIHHQLDRVDIGRIVRREEEHGFGNFFRLAPTALRNRGRSEVEFEPRGVPPKFKSTALRIVFLFHVLHARLLKPFPGVINAEGKETN
jgi:hypothetical protein